MLMCFDVDVGRPVADALRYDPAHYLDYWCIFVDDGGAVVVVSDCRVIGKLEGLCVGRCLAQSVESLVNLPLNFTLRGRK